MDALAEELEARRLELYRPVCDRCGYDRYAAADGRCGCSPAPEDAVDSVVDKWLDGGMETTPRTSIDLGAELAAGAAAWEAASPAERAASRAAYLEAGWKLCSHDDCPPWSCSH